jgi:EAL domain-containing protein (putative c-di-GMP-specific phosphodiesterase class I)
MGEAGAAGRILLVDDDPGILRSYARVLEVPGRVVETASSGRQAIDLLRKAPFDVVVSDVAMPEMGGLEFLRAVREHDLDIPVVLVTGLLDIEPAIRAMEYGAFRYLVKPVEVKVLEETVQRAIRMHGMAKLKRQALELLGAERRGFGDRAGLEARFAMAVRLLFVAFQPVVSWRTRRLLGYEALARSQEPSMSVPADLFAVAERLGRVQELGRAIRQKIAEVAPTLPDNALLFVNLHVAELADLELCSPGSPLASIANRVVLELSERAPLDAVQGIQARVAKLRQNGFTIALDDVGAGNAGLAGFALLEPDIVKLDIALVRGIDSSAPKRALLRSMVALCGELGMRVIGEGVETAAERDALDELGCELQQGYLFARPDRGLPVPAM